MPLSTSGVLITCEAPQVGGCVLSQVPSTQPSATLMGEAETSLLFELTIFIMQGWSTHGGNKFRGRKALKVKEATSLEGERFPKLWKKQVERDKGLQI